MNINTHHAYRGLHNKRLAMERANETFTGHPLVGQLGQNSERGRAYIDDLHQIIRGNNLE